MEGIMKFSHELIVREEGFPFKLFVFEGGGGNYYRKNTGTDRLKSLRYAQVNWSFLLMTGDGILRRIIL